MFLVVPPVRLRGSLRGVHPVLRRHAVATVHAVHAVAVPAVVVITEDRRGRDVYDVPGVSVLPLQLRIGGGRVEAICEEWKSEHGETGR